jgi:predicted nucleotidyltransferase
LGEILVANSAISRKRVVTEAANLIYNGLEKEYKQAKMKAAKTFGLHYMPTNIEVVIELDRIADEIEGPARQERLVLMRKEALRIMRVLQKYDPLLTGSVWRGTIHHGSDLDVVVHYEDPEEVLKTLEHADLKVLKAEWVNVTIAGKKRASFHIDAESPIEEQVEIIVRSLEEACLKEKCDIYGDKITGLRIDGLRKVLKESPTQRFVPF